MPTVPREPIGGPRPRPGRSPRPVPPSRAGSPPPAKPQGSADVSPYDEYESAVAAYTEAGAQETIQRIVTALSRLNRRLDVFYRQQFDQLDVSPGDWSVLVTVALERGNGVSPSALADHGGVSPSTMTHRLDGMVARGLVRREPDPDNRTRTNVRLTDEGWALFRRSVLEAEVVESKILSPLDDVERRQLAALLERLVAGLRPNRQT